MSFLPEHVSYWLSCSSVQSNRKHLTLGISLQDPDAVIKLHRLDVEGRQDAFFILQRGVVDIVLIG